MTPSLLLFNCGDYNIYSEKMIYEILNKYMDECRKGLLKGERVQLKGIGTIIPEVRTRERFNIPECNKEGGNLPYTAIKMTRTLDLQEKMNCTLLNNIKNGIMGLEETPFSKQQISILKKYGFISDEQTEYEEE